MITSDVRRRPLRTLSSPTAAALVAIGLAACAATPPAPDAAELAEAHRRQFHPDRPVDLATLRSRAAPHTDRATQHVAYREILSLRDRPQPGAVPVLTAILDDRAQRSDVTSYAAAQALFTDGSDAALRAIEERASTPAFHGRWAFDSAFTTDMEPGRRDAFLTRFVLRNAGDAPAIQLSVRDTSDAAVQRFTFEITFRNALGHELEIDDLSPRDGDHLVFRAADGRVAKTQGGLIDVHGGTPVIRLAPGESRTVTADVEIVRAELGHSAGIDEPGAANVAGWCNGYNYLIDAPGPYDVVARWTTRKGRSISAPVRVNVHPLR